MHSYERVREMTIYQIQTTGFTKKPVTIKLYEKEVIDLAKKYSTNNQKELSTEEALILLDNHGVKATVMYNAHGADYRIEEVGVGVLQ